MRKLLIITIIALSAFTASAQSIKPKQEVKPVDSTIIIKITPQQLGQIQSIISQAASLISSSNSPMKEGMQNIQALNAVLGFFKQYEPQQKK